VMITEDDARTTIDIGDRYVIQPAFKEWSVQSNWPDTAVVADGFRYASDTNEDWLDDRRLNAMIEESGL